MNTILQEAKRLHDLGFAIHLLHPKSKRPIESAWTSGPKKTWEYIKSNYRDGMNIGVRLGKESKVQDGYLGVIDIDIKSKDPKHLAEAEKALATLTLGASLPMVKSGRGGGSKHIYVVTSRPLTPIKAFESKDIVKVFMPSALNKPSKRDRDNLSEKEIEDGYRMRSAWEIGIMGEGQQVVLPPSIHPDSKKPYVWSRTLNAENVATIDTSHFPTAAEKVTTDKKDSDIKEETNFDFKITPVELSWLPISDKIRNMILTGEGVEDRSASLLPVSHALLKAGCDVNEILTVLSDKETYLGECAYHHAQTANRMRAMKWLYRYTVKKVFDDNSAEKIFGTEIPESRELTFDELNEQDEIFSSEKKWTDDLDTTDRGRYRGTIRNVVSILENSISPEVIKRDIFAFRDFYNQDTPWGGRKGEAIVDDDIQSIKHWFGNHWGVEPSDGILSGGLTVLALRNAFDPVKEMLEAMPEWDGVDRLDTWLKDHFNAEGNDEYLAQVFRKWMVAMVLRCFEPGAKFDWMPIFEGPQGAGKSSFGRLLVGDKFFLDWLPDLANKDAALGLQGVWAVEMGELASFRKNEIESVKAFITRTVDKVRPPYGQRWLESPRRCVFFGTTNYDTYLRDESGNRRFKPVKVGRLDFKQLIKDRPQLFAEALFLYRSGFEDTKNLDITGDAKDYEVQIQAEKMVADEASIMFETLKEYFEKIDEMPENSRPINRVKFSARKLFKNDDIYQGIPPLSGYPLNTRNMMFAGKALKMLGAQKTKIMGVMYWKLLKGIP